MRTSLRELYYLGLSDTNPSKIATVAVGMSMKAPLASLPLWLVVVRTLGLSSLSCFDSVGLYQSFGQVTVPPSYTDETV